MDRAFPMRRIYGDGKFYETGIGRGRKRALVMMTVGGVPAAYNGYGVNPPMRSILAPICSAPAGNGEGVLPLR